MKTNNIIRAATITGLAVIALSAAETDAKAQITAGSVEAVVGSTKPSTYGRATFEYKVPLTKGTKENPGKKASCFSFIELYQPEEPTIDGDTTKGSFFGKNMCGIDIGGTVLSAELETQHSGKPISKAGAGIGIKIPMPKGGWGKLKLMPAWAGGDETVIDKIMAGYSAGYSRGIFDVASFANFNRHGIDYGEYFIGIRLLANARVSQILKGLQLGYNPAFYTTLEPDGSRSRHYDHRVQLGFVHRIN